MTAFVDAQVYPPVPSLLDGPIQPFREGLEAQFGPLELLSAESLADRYRHVGGRAAILGWDSESVDHLRPFSSADVAGIVATAPDVFWGFGAVDPAKGALAVAQVHEAARLGMVGVALHAAAQGMSPAGRMTAPVWEAASDHGLICFFHSGLPRLGAGLAGGGGVRLAAGNPLHIDGVAARFPDLRIVIAHAGDLWCDEAIAVATHKRNVWLVPSGIGPSGWPKLADAANGVLADRILLGSGFPFGSPHSVIDDWERCEVDGDVVDRVIRANALELFEERAPVTEPAP